MLWNKPSVKLYSKFKHFHSKNASENAVCKMASISSGSQCAKHGITHITLQWSHNKRNSLLSRLFSRRSKKTSKLRVTGFCAGKSPRTVEFPAQMASYAENVSIWWRHHELQLSDAHCAQHDDNVMTWNFSSGIFRFLHQKKIFRALLETCATHTKNHAHVLFHWVLLGFGGCWFPFSTVTSLTLRLWDGFTYEDEDVIKWKHFPRY